MADASDQLPDPAAVDRATETLDTVAADWVTRRGVLAVEVARRWKDGSVTNEVAIRVTLERLLPRDDVPEGELFPSEVEGVPVDLVEGSPIQPE